MARRMLTFLAGLGAAATLHAADGLPARWEDLSSADFVKAVHQANEVCLLPMGSIDKFGPSGPVGTDLYLVRLIALEAVKREYAVVFPAYFAGGTNEMSNLPGTVTYSPRLQLDLLEETTSEMARNGCRKILIVNGNSGNNSLISWFMSTFSAAPHDYTVYNIYGSALSPNAVDGTVVAAAQPSRGGVDGHGGEDRISAMLAYYPELVHTERGHDEAVATGPAHPGDPPVARAPVAQAGPPGGSQTQQVQGIVTRLQTGYGGDASGATAARGEALVKNGVDVLVKGIQAVKADNSTLKLQREFYEHRANPVATK